MGCEYASLESAYEVDADSHIGGTVTRGINGSTEFWLTAPRPKGTSLDEWERLQQEKWDRIFHSKKERDD